MKRSLTMLTALFVVGLITANAQSEKQKPLPKVNLTKFNPPVISESGKDHNEFLRKNPMVANIDWKDPLHVIIRLKNKKVENYDLSLEAEKKIFVEKYGEPPMPPPPPPPKKTY